MERYLSKINDLIFNNDKINKITDSNNKQWYKLNDIVEILEYNQDDSIKYNKKYREKIENIQSNLNITDGDKNTIYVNEQAIYELIFSSKELTAINFKKYIFEKELPLIRKQYNDKMKEQKAQQKNKSQRWSKARFNKLLNSLC